MSDLTKAFIAGVPAVIILLFFIFRKSEEEIEDPLDYSPEPQEDSVVPRNRFWRAIVCYLCSITVVLGPSTILFFLTGMFHPTEFWLLTEIQIGLPTGIICLGYVLRYITISVPEQQGMTPLNPLRGKLVVYGPGWHPRFPWESVHRADHISLDEVTERVPGNTIPSEDSEMTLTFMFRYRPRLAKLEVFRAKGESTVTNGFKGFFQGFFSSYLSKLPGEKARDGMAEINARAKAAFNLPIPKQEEAKTPKQKDAAEVIDERLPSVQKVKEKHDKSSRTQQDNYGVQMMNVELTDMDFSKRVQEARDGKAESKQQVLSAMEAAGFDPNNPNDVEAYKKLPHKEKKEWHEYALLNARVPNYSKQTINFEGNPPPGFLGGIPKGNGGNHGRSGKNKGK